MSDLSIGLDQVEITRPRRPLDEDAASPGDGDETARAPTHAGALAVLHRRFAALLDAERDRWVLWTPVCFGLGIGLYFAARQEPSPALATGLVLGALGLRLVVAKGAIAVAATGALLCLSLGFGAAKLRTLLVAAPILQQETRIGAITGWIEHVEARQPKGFRLLIRVATVEGLAPEATPALVRVRAAFDSVGVVPGDAVSVKAKLFPPAAPERPGGYDFARLAYFEGVGATGFLIEPPAPATLGAPPWWRRPSLGIERLRLWVSERIRAVLPGETGAVTDALITGERGRIPEATDTALRDAGLSHVLAISGANMAIMAGALFGFVRALLALVPVLVLRFPIKKWAALAGFVGAVFCLILSGAESPAARAFVMIALMLLALLLDRPAVSLRNLALAALVLLTMAPEVLLDVGFQMSFAAVVALVAVFEWVVAWRADKPKPPRPEGFVARSMRFWGRFLAVTFFSTIVASLAVAPLAAFHFHKLAQLGIIANMIVAPVFAFYIMPLAVVALVALPFGIETLPLVLIEKGVAVMLAVAHWAAGLTGAPLSVPETPALAIALMILGGLWMALWLRPWRLLGLAGIAAGLVLAVAGGRPDVIVASDARVVAVRGADGVLTALPVRGNAFELADWLAADGDARDAKEVAKAQGFACDAAGCVTAVRGLQVAVSETPESLDDDCRRAHILIVRFALERACSGPKLVLDAARLLRDGAHRLRIGAGGRIGVETVASYRGQRPWTGAPDAGTLQFSSGEQAWSP
ncbi:MAG: ComEC/Rec2 family competence protein [Hyphomicrobiaceae bacterium]